MMGTERHPDHEQFLYPSRGYDSRQKDFAPIILVGMLPMVIPRPIRRFRPARWQSWSPPPRRKPDKIDMALPSNTPASYSSS